MTRRPTCGGLVTALLWALLAAILLVWARGYLPDDLYLRPHQGRLVVMFASPYYSQYIDPAEAGPSATVSRWSTQRAVEDARLWVTRAPGRRQWQWAGFELISGRPSTNGDGYFVLAVPCWFLALPLAAACGWRLATRRRRRLRELPGHCRACGYDLTGNASGICPECGTPAVETRAVDLSARTPAAR